MSSNRHSDVRDVSGQQRPGGGGMHIAQTWLCGHKHTTGKIRSMGRGLPAMRWQCADCAKVKA